MTTYTFHGEDENADIWLRQHIGWQPADTLADAIVVDNGWQTDQHFAREVIIAHWRGIPVYKVGRTSQGYRLEHVQETDDTLAYIHTIHAKGYRVRIV